MPITLKASEDKGVAIMPWTLRCLENSKSSKWGPEVVVVRRNGINSNWAAPERPVPGSGASSVAAWNVAVRHLSEMGSEQR